MSAAPTPVAPTTAPPTLLCIVPNPSIDKTVEVPALTPGTIHRPETVIAVAGGKGLNVARAAATLGVPVHAVLVLGGHAGRWMTAELGRRDIARSVTWIRGETRTCLSVLDRSSGAMTEVYEPGPTISAAEWRRFVGSAARVANEAPVGSVAAISGSFPRGAPDEAATQLLTAIARSGVRLLVDTSGPHLAAALEAHPALVKVNADEASSVLDRPITGEADAIDAARRLVDRGAERAIVTRGADGAVAVDARRVWVVEPLPDGGPFSVGSGDAFLAGFAAGLLADASADRCLRLAAGAAAANTRTPGAGELDAETASRLAAAVRIRPAV